ncbi:uncharacterized protein LOC107303773 [Oryza brachyantha]|uniref:uncharacterized protein LOC107303773 n=1 Tax=Oryza brachyantha TaxID=4533 RepID=UPI001ADA6BA8|nr:uncharacterized protein LOC107303773 [Oryza brachyantha]
MESLIKSISVCGQTFQIKEKESCTPPLPMLSCGTSSFKHVDDGPGPSAAGCGGTGGRSPKLPGRKHGGGKANPYAGCGLDKFSTVLAELETRRNRILRRVGSDTGLVMVRFVQSNGAWAPVVVKLPDDEHRLRDASAARKARPPKRTTAAVEPASRPAAPSTTQPQASSDPASPSKVPPARRRRSAESSLSFSWGRMRRPACYWPAAIVLMLACLAVFGRVFAICCTSIWWYLAPTLSDGPPASLRKSMEKRRTASPPVNAAKKVVISSRGAHEVGNSPRGRGKLQTL